MHNDAIVPTWIFAHIVTTSDGAIVQRLSESCRVHGRDIGEAYDSLWCAVEHACS
jgi:hypothetical protein